MKAYRAGESVEDLCRACKIDRVHTVVAADASGRPIRVQCDYCGSQHNFRGGSNAPEGRPSPRGDSPPAPGEAPPERIRGDGRLGVGAVPAGMHQGQLRRAGVTGDSRQTPAGSDDVPPVSDRERVAPPMTLNASEADLEALLRRVIRAESGVTVSVPADRWRDGLLVLRPGKPGLQEKSWPIETFFHKVVMIRNRLRTLEQQLNAMDLPEDAKVKMQAYITACYGSLTSFNVLFADEDDHFKGSGE